MRPPPKREEEDTRRMAATAEEEEVWRMEIKMARVRAVRMQRRIISDIARLRPQQKWMELMFLVSHPFFRYNAHFNHTINS